MKNISWEQLKSSLCVGELVQGRITKHEPYGVFVGLELPFEGLIQIIDFKDEGVMSSQEYPPTGQLIEAVVLGFKETGHQIWLGVRPSQLACAKHRQQRT